MEQGKFMWTDFNQSIFVYYSFLLVILIIIIKIIIIRVIFVYYSSYSYSRSYIR